jgi:hypothetical protein
LALKANQFQYLIGRIVNAWKPARWLPPGLTFSERSRLCCDYQIIADAQLWKNIYDLKASSNPGVYPTISRSMGYVFSKQRHRPG